MAMSSQVTKISLRPNSEARRPVSIAPLKAAFQCFRQVQDRKLKKLRVLQRKREPSHLVASSKNDSNINISSSSPSLTIKQFYSAINEKNLDQLKTLLADDCFFEDYSFLTPFKGKMETMHYLDQLITSMGQNIEFHVEHICEGDGYTSGVNWHLVWKKKPVPCTRGSSYFELSRRKEKLVIMKARVTIESPIKPGGLALALFAIVTSSFDAFPEAAERFLGSPQVILQLLLKFHNMFFKPIVDPLLTWYIKLWSFTINLLHFIYKILQYISKIFYM